MTEEASICSSLSSLSVQDLKKKRRKKTKDNMKKYSNTVAKEYLVHVREELMVVWGNEEEMDRIFDALIIGERLEEVSKYDRYLKALLSIKPCIKEYQMSRKDIFDFKQETGKLNELELQQLIAEKEVELNNLKAFDTNNNINSKLWHWMDTKLHKFKAAKNEFNIGIIPHHELLRDGCKDMNRMENEMRQMQKIKSLWKMK